jgi:uncharacterized membrane protein YbhN (UPF0104 family)
VLLVLLGSLLACFVTFVVVARWAEVRQTLGALTRASGPHLLAALGLQGVGLALYAASYRTALKMVEIERRLRDLAPLLLVALVLAVTVPGAGLVAQSVLVVGDAARRGDGVVRAATASVLTQVADILVIALLVVPSGALALLGLRGGLETG